MHQYQDLIKIFDQTFFSSFNTRLIKGDDEPIYLPESTDCPYNQVFFAHGYFASGLHEISHWCIAGEARRKQVDFGYWYEPDGRTQAQQALFESVEIKPQALEWAFCIAAQKSFNVSVDNLNGDVEPNANAFKLKVFEQVKSFLANGFPERGEMFIQALASFYQTKLPLTLEQFLTPFEQDKLVHMQMTKDLEVDNAEV